MNLLDLAILVAIALAAVAGYRLGFLARAVAWVGLAFGVVVAIYFLPGLVTTLHAASRSTRIFAAFAFVFGLAALGQALGYGLGALLHATLPIGAGLRQGDRVAGAAVGGFGALIAVWLLIPAMATAPGWPARAARGSVIVREVNRVAPEPPRSLEAALGKLVNDAPYPEVRDPLTSSAGAGAPPVLSLSADVTARVAASTVRVEGQACDQVQDGTGWVAAPDLVVTNAHVVAGEQHTTLHLPDGRQRPGVVVAFDSGRDLAVVRVARLGLAPLTLRAAAPGDVGAVFGHPGGGDLRVAPARIADEIVAVGTDIYRTTDTRRDVFVLAARLAPGDSGGPLVDSDGQVSGVAFAIDPAHATTGYALTDGELRPVLARAGTVAVDTGGCLVE